jgi:hypothetical protein
MTSTTMTIYISPSSRPQHANGRGKGRRGEERSACREWEVEEQEEEWEGEWGYVQVARERAGRREEWDQEKVGKV